MNTKSVVSLRLGSVGLALALAVGVAGKASATGFYVNQQGVMALGRVFAGSSVAADDLATIFFNPAGLGRVVRETPKRKHIAVAAHLISPRSDQRARLAVATTPGSANTPVPITGGDAHNPTGITPVLNGYWASPVGDRGAWGIGVNFPFGLKARFDPDWHGRYDATEASLLTINVSAVGAYRFDSGLSVGGGIDLQSAKTVLASAIPDPLAPGGPSAATDARIRTEGKAFTVGFNVGVIYELTADTHVAAHYRSGMKHRIDGTSDVAGLTGPLAFLNGTVGADATLRLPSIVSFGVRTKVGKQIIALSELQWFNWSTFDEVRIRFADGRPDAVRVQNYRDAWAFAAGVEYPMSTTWTARGGLRYDATPTVDGYRDTIVPDAKRLWLGAGTTWAITDNFKLDLAFNHVFFSDTSIALTRTFFDGTPLASAVTMESGVSTVVNTIAGGLRFGF